jgi:hypothetical protein
VREAKVQSYQEFCLADFIVGIFRNNFARKVRAIKNEQAVIRLFEQYLFLNQTTKDEVEGFLRSNQISFEVPKGGMNLSSSFKDEFNNVSEEISTYLVGPSVWQGFLPYGSHYYVRFIFIEEILSTIKAVHVIYHF